MDIKIRIEWPEMVSAVREHLASVATVSEEPLASEEPDVAVTLEELRARLTKVSQAGKQEEVKALLASFGAKKLTEIPKERYAEVVEALCCMQS